MSTQAGLPLHRPRPIVAPAARRASPTTVFSDPAAVASFGHADWEKRETPLLVDPAHSLSGAGSSRESDLGSHGALPVAIATTSVTPPALRANSAKVHRPPSAHSSRPTSAHSSSAATLVLDSMGEAADW
eukprot:CAMPEP_0196686670 /NCGR_PEP_ID=MMETSP1090-20130531/13006_1 /TAXON_ID=37098 /ORGANISM="Isochrysis sp, Strain CCMP1244" /LENGTH=129 /DNA_ID=CAMNT_0042025329 /DNA_START=96 /DNA_END=482 /DNA_ORIENTATION=+